MAVVVEEHPADLALRADELDAEAEELREEAERLRTRAKERNAQAAALRSKADRILNPDLGVSVRRRAPARSNDTLLAAAGLAVEDLPGTFQITHLAAALEIGTVRAQALCDALVDLGHIEVREHGYRAVDPEAARVRDAVVELKQFTRASLAMKLEVRPDALTWYLHDLRQRGIIAFDTIGGPISYVETGAERVVTRRPRRLPPEQAVVDKELNARRGAPVEFTGRPMVETGGSQRRAAERRQRGGATKKKKQRGK